jgi:CRP/FNR family transcriptional regulator
MMATATAKTTTTICRTAMSDVERYVRTDPEFALAWGHLLMEEIRRSREAVFHLGPHAAGVRLARLLCLMERGSPAPERRNVVSSIHITHSELAASLSIAQETATRLLSEFEDRKILRLQRGRVEILDMDRLLALAGYPGSEVDLEKI